jgi:hypothetical protein
VDARKEIMITPFNEAEIRAMVEVLKRTEPNISGENVVKEIRAQLELKGIEWNDDLERKVRYCVHIHPK